MRETVYQSPCGPIHYWISILNLDAITLVFLPGLTADHRLFDKQIDCFCGRYNIVVWDAPAHAASWPFQFNFDLFDKAKWLNTILEQEKIAKPVIVGQSMGGYVGQVFAQLYPDQVKGFISVDSAPLQRKYVTAAELWLLKRMEPIYAHYPWKLRTQDTYHMFYYSGYSHLETLIMAAASSGTDYAPAGYRANVKEQLKNLCGRFGKETVRSALIEYKDKYATGTLLNALEEMG